MKSSSVRKYRTPETRIARLLCGNKLLGRKSVNQGFFLLFICFDTYPS